MPLEDIEGAGKYLGSLNPANPISNDEKREGDNHIRGVKNTLRNTFPNVNAEVTATAAQLNQAVAVAGDPANVPLTGKETLVELQGGNLQASMTGKRVWQNTGAAWVLDAAAVWAGGERIVLENRGATCSLTLAGGMILHCAGEAPARPGTAAVSLAQWSLVELRLVTPTLAILSDAVTAPYEPGYRDVPLGSTLGAAAEPVLADRGRAVVATGASITVPANVFPAGTVLTVVNDNAGALTLTQGAGLALTLNGGTVAGNRTIPQGGVCSIWFRSTTVAKLSGPGAT